MDYAFLALVLSILVFEYGLVFGIVYYFRRKSKEKFYVGSKDNI